jgi:hypothetical protein
LANCYYQDFEIKDIVKTKLNDKPFGDIVCKECNYVIATLSNDIECKINITRLPLCEHSHRKIFVADEILKAADEILEECNVEEGYVFERRDDVVKILNSLVEGVKNGCFQKVV